MSTSERLHGDCGNCPVCQTPLTDCPPIAIVCENPDCPVKDDCDLWYVASDGTWKAQHWIPTKIDDHITRLTLSDKE